MVPRTFQRDDDSFLFEYWDDYAPRGRRFLKRQNTRFMRRDGHRFIAEGQADFEQTRDIGPRFYKVRKLQSDMLIPTNPYTGDRYYCSGLESARFGVPGLWEIAA